MKFLNIDPASEKLSLLTFKDKDFYSHEGLEAFLEIEAPDNTKYMLDSKGIIVIPETGEIAAFQFGRFESTFKLVDPSKGFSRKRRRIFMFFWKDELVENSNVRFGYFSNESGDEDTIIDITHLGREWALGINILSKE